MGEITVAIVLAILAAFSAPILMFALVLRFGPASGHWNQPAPGFTKAPGWLSVALWLVGIMHVVIGGVLIPEYGFYLGVVSAAMGMIWICMAQTNWIVRKLGWANKAVEKVTE